MSDLRIAPIVEGHGEVEAASILLDRIWRELLLGEYAEVLRPVRCPRSRLLKSQPAGGQSVPDRDELGRAVRLAALKLAGRAGQPLPSLVLVLLDADLDCPKELAPELLDIARSAASPYETACVLAKVEYETWFVAAAESLAGFLMFGEHEVPPTRPEESRSGKAWVRERFRGGAYSETVDQPRMTAKMDLSLCRRRSPSFDKLCRDLEKHLRPASAQA